MFQVLNFNPFNLINTSYKGYKNFLNSYCKPLEIYNTVSRTKAPFLIAKNLSLIMIQAPNLNLFILITEKIIKVSKNSKLRLWPAY